MAETKPKRNYEYDNIKCNVLLNKVILILILI